MHMTAGGPPPGGEIIANTWVRYGGQYYYCRGWRPTGEPRIIPMARAPYGKDVWVLDPDGGLAVREHVPFKLTGGTVVWLVLALAALAFLPWPLGAGGSNHVFAWMVTAVVVGICLVAAGLCQTGHLYPHDDISLAQAQQAAHEAWLESERLRHHNAAVDQARAYQQGAQWQGAIWAQLASMNPNQGTFPPYGQQPPL
jgi:hypothetical protein